VRVLAHVYSLQGRAWKENPDGADRVDWLNGRPHGTTSKSHFQEICSACYPRFYFAACRSAGFEPNIVKQSDRAQSILDLVAAGVGIAIVPEHFQRYRTELLLRRFIPDLPALSLCMV
jgi:DNA-binding transcriptional LysR family regulator